MLKPQPTEGESQILLVRFCDIITPLVFKANGIIVNQPCFFGKRRKLKITALQSIKSKRKLNVSQHFPKKTYKKSNLFQ